jgi:hypothetical protein
LSPQWYVRAVRFSLAAALFAVATLLVGATTSPAPVAADNPPPADQADPPGDYTSRSLYPPLAPEFDPGPPPPPPSYAEAPDEDGLRQCVGADGVPIFTDRRCGDLGATARPPAGTPGISGSVVGRPLRVRTCARNQGDLLAGVRAALENHDANRLADYYHWSGMGTSEGYRLMERLDSFSARPVVDVQLVRNAQPESDPYGYGFDYGFNAPPPPGPEADATDATDPLEAAEAPPPRRRPHASLLRVDQMRSNEDVASTITYFHLLTNAGCWWMRF